MYSFYQMGYKDSSILCATEKLELLNEVKPMLEKAHDGLAEAEQKLSTCETSKENLTLIIDAIKDGFCEKL